MRRLFKNKKILIVLSLILFLGFFLAVGLEAADPSSLEVNWPTAPGGKDLTPDSMLVDFVEYCYRWGILLGGLAVFIALIVAGFKYLTSVGDPGKMKDARERIFAAIAGLILLLSTYLILNTINPELTTLVPPTTTVAGLGAGNWSTGNLYEPCVQATLYREINFADPVIVLTKANADNNDCIGSGWSGWMWGAFGWGGEKIRSVRIEGACQVNIYEHSGCSGAYSAIGKSQGNLDWAGLDTVHSFEITDITPPGKPEVKCCCPEGTCTLKSSVASGTGCYVIFQGVIPDGGLNRNDGLQVWFEYADDEDILNIKGNAPDDYGDRETIYEEEVPFDAASDNLTSTTYYWRVVGMGAGFGFSTTGVFELDSSCNINP